MILTILAFAVAFLLTTSLGVLFFYRQKALKRLSQVVSQAVDADLLRSLTPTAGRRIERLVKPFENVVPRSREDVLTLEKRLNRAGYRNKTAVSFFYSSKVLVPGSLCLLAFVTGIYWFNPMFIFGLTGGIGFLLPDFWLGRRISARQTDLRLGLPEALDLIVICVEAGLSMDKATMRASEELRLSQPAIAEELNLVYLEQRAGRPRSDTWKDFAERTGVESIRSLASILIQADKFGTGIGKTLRAHSEMLRARRRQDAEEQAAKTTVKLVFPLVLFIFPSLFVVTLGPSLIIMREGFLNFLN